MAEALPFLKLNTDFLESEEADAFEAATGQDPFDLVTLWLWMLRHQPWGDLEAIHPRVLAKRMQWKGDPAELLPTLQEAGLLVRERAADGSEMLRFRGWGVRYDPPLMKRVRDNERRKGRRLESDSKATALRPESDSKATRSVRGEERRGEEKETQRELRLPAEPAAEQPGPEASSPSSTPPADPVQPRRVLQGDFDHLAPGSAAKHGPLLEAICEAHRKAFKAARARSPKADDAKHLRALLRDEKRKPSEVVKAVIGMSRDPWPERRQHNRWSHLRRDFDKYLAWFDDPPEPADDRAAIRAASRAALEEANGLHRRPA